MKAFKFVRNVAATCTALLAISVPAVTATAQAQSTTGVKTVLLVHGAWADGSSWSKLIPLLEAKGLHVVAVQNPLTSLVDDVATTKRAIALQDGAVLLVGHSYGGAVITEAGNDPKVKGLVYVAAFAPGDGESVSSLIANPPPGAAVPPILPPQDGYLFLDRAKFAASFAADVNPAQAAFMAASQVP